MYIVSATTEIAAPPATVRAKLLDFKSIPTYSPNGFIRSITPVADKLPPSLEAGDQLKCVVGYGKMKFTSSVLENSPSKFSWSGSFLGIFIGEHMFRFEEVPGDKNRTRFVHEEHFTGLISFLIGENAIARSLGMRADTQKGFEEYNRDFKAWVEREDPAN